ncbi:unnamed protein product [Echinostoma caproni]|uniref:AF4/FMR2 family member 1 n=1 Tax=Echinostoma caproni TaxID=27848 RepID=A0A183B3K5_9TREM|nr:unnamed protein product [Echinostoma caproni]
MMEIISPPTEVTQAFNPLPLRFKMHEMTSDDVHSPSPSPPGLESAHTGREDSLSASGSPNYPKASSASTIPYPSPPILPPLDLSSVPTSPEKDQGRTEKMGTDLAVDRSPLNDTTACDPSSESHSSPNPINYHSKCTDTTAPSAEDNGDSCSGENRQTKVPSTSTAESHPLCSEVVASSFVSDSPVNDWTQLLQNFAEFCQGKVKLPGQPEQETSGECNSKKPRVDEDGELGSKTTPSMDALSQFQAMFLSMGQMLFNSQTNPVPPLPPSSTSLGSPVKSGEDINETKEKLSTPVTQSDVQSTPLSLATSTYPVTGLTSPTSSSSGITRAPLPPSILPIPGMPNFPSPSSVPAGSEFGMSSQSPLAFTASLLAMLASQNTNMSGGKSIRPPQSLNEISPFGPPANLLLPNPFLPGPTSSHNASQGNHVPTGSFPPARVPPIFPNAPTNSCSAVPFFGPPLSSNKLPGLPDNRELLYQLGQQLMAMAAASGWPLVVNKQ